MHVGAPAVAVVGHVEWVQFAHVAELPRAGAVAHADDVFEEPAGGGAVAAVQLARLAGAATLFTLLGADEHGTRSRTRLGELGVTVQAGTSEQPTRRALTLRDDRGERTIVTLGARLEPASDDDEIDWSRLRGLGGVYFTAGDGGAARHAREGARVLVASPRAGAALADVPLDALVYSADDAVERAALERVAPRARLLVATEGERGGRWQDTGPGAASGSWEAVAPPGPVADTYGSGDSFAAGLTYGLAVGMDVADAIALGARCGAACMCGRGPYERQLGRDEL